MWRVRSDKSRFEASSANWIFHLLPLILAGILTGKVWLETGFTWQPQTVWGLISLIVLLTVHVFMAPRRFILADRSSPAIRIEERAFWIVPVRQKRIPRKAVSGVFLQTLHNSDTDEYSFRVMLETAEDDVPLSRAFSPNRHDQEDLMNHLTDWLQVTEGRSRPFTSVTGNRRSR